MGSYNMSRAGTTMTRPIAMLLTAFAGIALYNVIEISVMILFLFKKRQGLYFWSMITATTAIIPYTLCLMFKFFLNLGEAANWVVVSGIILGWTGMVTGQSIVLYSRLHLVLSSPRTIRFVLTLILTNFLISNIPTAVLVLGTNTRHPEPFRVPYGIYERIQVGLYFVQECVISGLYVFAIHRTLKSSGPQGQGKRNRGIMRHLLWVNILVIILDITLVIIEYIGFYEIQVLYKGAIYSVKLKLEFRILSQLREVATQAQRDSVRYFSASEGRGSLGGEEMAVGVSDETLDGGGGDRDGAREEEIKNLSESQRREHRRSVSWGADLVGGGGGREMVVPPPMTTRRPSSVQRGASYIV